MRAVSMVVREMLIARIHSGAGSVAPTSVARITRSEDRTSPVRAAMMNTCSGCSTPLKARVIMLSASMA